jgi:hypothetical protein
VRIATRNNDNDDNNKDQSSKLRTILPGRLLHSQIRKLRRLRAGPGRAALQAKRLPLEFFRMTWIKTQGQQPRHWNYNLTLKAQNSSRKQKELVIQKLFNNNNIMVKNTSKNKIASYPAPHHPASTFLLIKNYIILIFFLLLHLLLACSKTTFPESQF